MSLPNLTSGRGRRIGRRFLVGVAALAIVIPTAGSAVAAPTTTTSATNPDFGPNVKIFDPSMSTASIQAQTDAIFAQQDFNEFGTERYSLLFKPGVYGTADQPLNVKVGYYTEVAGLGQDPDDVTINGHVRAEADWEGNGNATQNFWRSAENMSVQLPSGTTPRSDSSAGAGRSVSQLADVNGLASGA